MNILGKSKNSGLNPVIAKSFYSESKCLILTEVGISYSAHCASE